MHQHLFLNIVVFLNKFSVIVLLNDIGRNFGLYRTNDILNYTDSGHRSLSYPMFFRSSFAVIGLWFLGKGI
jgi:hypothetical protein